MEITSTLAFLRVFLSQCAVGKGMPEKWEVHHILDVPILYTRPGLRAFCQKIHSQHGRLRRRANQIFLRPDHWQIFQSYVGQSFFYWQS